MPQAVLAVATAMGLYAGLRWLSKELLRHAEEAERVADAVRQQAAGTVPKDLGTLVYDAEAQVYRPDIPGK